MHRVLLNCSNRNRINLSSSLMLKCLQIPDIVDKPKLTNKLPIREMRQSIEYLKYLVLVHCF